MKKMMLCFFACSFSLSMLAQKEDDDKKKLFNKENLFTGGTANLAFGNLSTSVGIIPFFGYSINKFVDVGVTVQYTYISERDYPYIGDKVRQKVFGPGAFVRLFPFDFLFAQAQYEFNMIRIKYLPYNSGGYKEKYKLDAHSLLVGGGYAGGKDWPSEKSYYYVSVLWDIAKAYNSPYKDNLNRAVPIIRAGYNIALFQGGGKRRR